MPIAKINNIHIYYEQHGSGDDLILIGGLSADHQVWKSSLRLLSKHFRVLIFDSRGAGQSDAPDMPYSIELMASDTIQLMQHLRIQKAHIVGHSMGGCIAQQIAISHPTFLNKLVLVGSRAKRSELASLLLNMKLKLQKENISDELLAEYVMPFLFSESFLKNKLHVKGFIQWTLQNKHPQSLLGYEKQLHAVKDFNSSQQLSKIRAETLIIIGDADILVPEKAAQEMVNLMPNATLNIISDCAHMPHVEQAKIFAQSVLAFLT